MEKCKHIFCKNLFLSFLLYSFASIAQNTQTTSARALSLGGCGILLKDIGSYYSNPSLLAEQNSVSISCNYENNFFIPALQKTAFVVGLPTKKGVLGLGIRTSGITIFRSIESNLGYGINLNEQFSIGARIGINNTSIQGYGNKFALYFVVGFVGVLNEKLKYAFTFQQFGNTRKTDLNPFDTPSKINFGTQYLVSNMLSIYSELEKMVGYPMRFKIACEYLPLKVISFRLGVASSGYSLSSGFGYTFHTKLRVDIGATWQPILGTSIHTGLVYAFKDSEKHE